MAMAIGPLGGAEGNLTKPLYAPAPASGSPMPRGDFIYCTGQTTDPAHFQDRRWWRGGATLRLVGWADFVKGCTYERKHALKLLNSEQRCEGWLEG